MHAFRYTAFAGTCDRCCGRRIKSSDLLRFSPLDDTQHCSTFGAVARNWVCRRCFPFASYYQTLKKTGDAVAKSLESKKKKKKKKMRDYNETTTTTNYRNAICAVDVNVCPI